MRVTTDHLEKVRALLGAASAQFAAQTKAAKEAEEARLALDARWRALQGSFDTLAAAYAGDVEPSVAQLDGLPADVRGALGYVKPEPAGA